MRLIFIIIYIIIHNLLYFIHSFNKESLLNLDYLEKTRRQKKQKCHRQRYRISKKHEKFNDYIISAGEAFIKTNWPPIVAPPATLQLNKRKVTSYYQGGADWSRGRSKWERPCFSNDFRYHFIGDSQLRVFKRGNTQFESYNICSFGGADIRLLDI